MTTYQDSENSVASGKPVEFYHFADDTGGNFRITSAETAQVHNSYTYNPEPCKRSERRIYDSHKKNAMTFELARANAFAVQYISGPLEGKATIQVYRGHEGNVVPYWFGTIISVKFDGKGVPTVTAEPRSSSISRVGRRRRCQRLCDHALYDSGCKLNETAWTDSGTVDSVSGLVVTSTTFGGQSDGYFIGGKLIVGDAKRLMKAHVGNDVTLSRAIAGLSSGASFDASAGCGHTPTACDALGNKINYGGEEFLPNQSPFANTGLG